ncbi:hypothetical protein FGB62_171g011 [Gracilaria domingensis]|nr:hypothetical protein FGB62_171g011 [Gracilaria domingensis]
MATTTAATAPPSTNGVWQTVSISSGALTPRHEACFVWSDGKGYLLGGRRVKPVDIFDPRTNSWTQGTNPGLQLHHMQCVAYKKKIYIVSAWTRGFPREANVDKIYIYDTQTDSWSTRPGLPENRRRGGSASVLYDDKIYVVAGNRGGHGSHATSLGWMDYYDLLDEVWVTNLPDLPQGEERDHVGGSVVNGNKLCIAGGRDGGVDQFFTATRKSTLCYSFASGVWQNMQAPIPEERAGASYGTTCAGHMMIAGGERTDAFSRVDVFDGSSWTTVASLKQKRHGSGLGVSACSCGHIFIASGSGRKGGSPELESTEVYLPTGNPAPCAQY